MSPAFPVKCQSAAKSVRAYVRREWQSTVSCTALMTEVADRPLRADAARNAERILRAARDVYGELGPDAADRGHRACAGSANERCTEGFPTKGDLIKAALDQSIAEDLSRR